MGRRHAPPASIGTILASPETHPYLVVKQDNNGTTFVVNDIEIPGLTAVIHHTARAICRPIGTWIHPTSHDIPEIPHSRTAGLIARWLISGQAGARGWFFDVVSWHPALPGGAAFGEVYRLICALRRGF
jgi:hypothetical protein